MADVGAGDQIDGAVDGVDGTAGEVVAVKVVLPSWYLKSRLMDPSNSDSFVHYGTGTTAVFPFGWKTRHGADLCWKV